MAFASTDDVAARLGRALADAEVTAATFLLEAGTAVIATAVDRDDSWAEELSPVPQVVRFAVVEMVCRALANPQGAASVQEQLGAYSYSQSFRKAAEGAGLMLTDAEETMVRRALLGQLSGSAPVESLVNDCCVICGLAPSLQDGLWLCGCDCGS